MPVRVEVDEDGEDAAVPCCVVDVPLEPRALTCTEHMSAYISIRQHTSAYVSISVVDVARGLRA